MSLQRQFHGYRRHEMKAEELMGTMNEQMGIIVKEAAAVEDWRDEQYSHLLDNAASNQWLLHGFVNSHRPLRRLEANMLS